MARKNRLIAAANLNLQEIEPLTQNQLLAFEADNNLVLHGVAGTGKSFISCYLGFDDILKNDKERIVLIRSAVPTRDIGFLPGNEKRKGLCIRRALQRHLYRVISARRRL